MNKSIAPQRGLKCSDTRRALQAMAVALGKKLNAVDGRFSHALRGLQADTLSVLDFFDVAPLRLQKSALRVQRPVSLRCHGLIHSFPRGIVSPWTGEQGKVAFYRQMAQADSRYTDEIQSLYPAITTPTLILWGREDSWIPLERGEELPGNYRY